MEHSRAPHAERQATKGVRSERPESVPIRSKDRPSVELGPAGRCFATSYGSYGDGGYVQRIRWRRWRSKSVLCAALRLGTRAMTVTP